MGPTPASIGRSLLALRHRDQVHSMDGHDDSATEDPLLSFDRHVSTLLLSLSSADDDALLSLPWIKKLLHSFLLIYDDFHSLIFGGRAKLPDCPHVNRLLSDFFDRAVKALDLLNAVRDGLDRVRHYRAHLDIAVSALGSSNPNSGQIHRARKSLAELSALILDQAAPDDVALAHRHRSFSHGGRTTATRHHLRTLSWSVSRSWSSSRQLQAMGASLVPPRAADISATGGLVVPIFTMGSVLVFVMWALAAAIPCGDRGVQTAHVAAPRSYPWAAPMAAMHEKIIEEAKRRERRSGGGGGGGGLLKEICRMETGAKSLMENLTVAEREGEMEKEREELAGVNEGLKEEVEGLERQVREVFHRIVRSRTEGLQCLNGSSN